VPRHPRGRSRRDIGDVRDRTLIAEIAAGSEVAFRQIHSRYYRRVESFTRGFTRRSELTEEITSDTLWVVWRSARRFKGASRVSTWIMGIAYHVSMKTLRTLSHRCEHEQQLIRDSVEETHEPWSETEICDWVGAALERLPEEQRLVLELSYQLGHSCQEIADRVNCPVGTVKTRMFHGRRKLRRLLTMLAG
jgi:RNA polymerase sigma-70 factor (ECF subfamily)